MSRYSAGWVLAFVVYALTSLAIVDSSLAQRVWSDGGGGVSIRAPFVRVDVGPYGGVSVRAPFANVDVPPDYYEPYPRYVEERVVEPVFPTASEIAAMDAGQLHNALVAINEQLQRRLSRFNTGDTWRRYLQLPASAVDPSLDADARREALASLLEKFQRIAADPQYPMIASLPAFVAMQDVLTEIITRPLQAPRALPDRNAVEPEELPLPAPEKALPPQPRQQQPVPPQSSQLPPPQSQAQPLPPQGERSFLRPRVNTSQ